MKPCALCPDPILPGEDTVEISAEPYNMPDGGEAHKKCADDAMLQSIMARQDEAELWYNR